jgi:hypothetical protein
MGPQRAGSPEVEAALAFSDGDGPASPRNIIEFSAKPPMSLYQIGSGTPPP